MTQTDYASGILPTFSFSQADLDANRQGELSEDQFYVVESVYRARQRGARQTTLLFAIWIPLLIIIGFVVEYTQSGKTLGEFLPGALPIVIGAGVGLGLLIAVVSGISARNARDARDKRISVAEGVAAVIVKPANTRYSSYLRYELVLRKGVLNKQLFRFANPQSIAHFEQGTRYRVYYIKYYPFPLMLSAEVI